MGRRHRGVEPDHAGFVLVSCNRDECNGADATIYRNAPELCADGVSNDYNVPGNGC